MKQGVLDLKCCQLTRGHISIKRYSKTVTLGKHLQYVGTNYKSNKIQYVYSDLNNCKQLENFYQ